MLDIKFIRDNLETVKTNCKNRNVFVDLDSIVSLDDRRRTSIQSLEDKRRLQNETADTVKKKDITPDERQKFIERGKQLKTEAQSLENELRSIQDELDALIRQVPNMTHPDSPVATTEDGNRELKKWGEARIFDFKPLDHVELGQRLDLIDFDSGAKVAGQKFFYLKGDAVLLEQALINYAIKTLRDAGYRPIATPDLARIDILDGIGFNPRGEETQIYSIANSDLCLIATAEITLGGMFADSILDEKNLPLKFVGLSHCFRTEAGAAGKESKGLYRVHQFSKVEMFAFTTPETSEQTHKEILAYEEKLFQGLGIPYRVVDICTGDLGGPAYRKYDIEAWMPTRGECGEYGEVTSTSNCTDYQARRLKIRFRRESEKKPVFVHMLNGTAIATSRALIAVMENYQQKDGTILVPEVLKPYMHGVEVIR